jgi:acyl-CoA thioesterase-2
MDARSWLGLEPTHNPHRWVLPVTDGLSTHGGFLFGGCGLGAAIEALEATTERPVVWATAQYLSYAMVGSMLDIDVTIAVSGHQITQARAVGHVADREVFTVNAALGTRPGQGEGQWETMPSVPSPDDLPGRTHPFAAADRQNITDRLDQRLAKGRPWDELEGNPGDGSAAMWIRLPDLLDMSAPALAILGDYVPFGIGQALGKLGGGNSLDNTLRVAQVVPTEWVLVDVRVHAIRNGFGHGLVHLWAQDGTLLGTASQSTIVRHWDQERLAVARQAAGGTNDTTSDEQEERRS